MRAACLLFASCLGFAAACERSRPSENPAAGANLILISIDTLRADRLGCYGYERPTSPAIDRLAERGARFARVIAESPWTLPSHMSLMTGLHPSHHGVTRRGQALSKSVPVLAEVLRNAGYRNFAVTGGGYVAASFGFGRAFEHYEDLKRRELRSVLTLARKRIESFTPEERYFLFLHAYDVHDPYDPPEPFRRMFQTRPPEDHVDPKLNAIQLNEMNLRPEQKRFLSDQYDASIRAADEDLNEFFSWLERRGAFADTIVIFLSDHGEAMGEHGLIGHGLTLDIEALRIPLIIVAPGVTREVVDEPAGLVDVAPTVLELLGLEAPATDGRSLVPFIRRHATPDAERPLFSEVDRGVGARKATRAAPVSKLLSIVRGRHHLIVGTDRRFPPKLFDLQEDPIEKHSLPINGEGDTLLKDLQAHLASLSPAGATGRATIPAAVAERLRALGYEDEGPSDGAP